MCQVHLELGKAETGSVTVIEGRVHAEKSEPGLVPQGDALARQNIFGFRTNARLSFSAAAAAAVPEYTRVRMPGSE